MVSLIEAEIDGYYVLDYVKLTEQQLPSQKKLFFLLLFVEGRRSHHYLGDKPHGTDPVYSSRDGASLSSPWDLQCLEQSCANIW